MTASDPTDPHVVIVGAGLAGLAAAKMLNRARVRFSPVDWNKVLSAMRFGFGGHVERVGMK